MAQEFKSPFDCPPWPNMIRVGFGDQTMMYCEIYPDGRIEFLDDPLDRALLTLTPDHIGEVEFILQHLKQCQEDWKENRKVREAESAIRDAEDDEPDGDVSQEQTRLELRPHAEIAEQSPIAMPAAVISKNGHRPNGVEAKN